MLFSKHRIGRRTQGGFSFIEFISCLAAIGGGLVLGLVCLGFDLKEVAADALDYVDTIAFEETTTQEDGATNDVLVATSEPSEPTASKAPENETTIEPNTQPISTQSIEQASQQDELAVVESDTATQVYWKALASCMQKEIKQRKSIVSSSGDWLLYDYLTHRKTCHQEVVSTLENLDDTEVDSKLRKHARQVLSWHRAGAKLYGRAVELLTDSPTADLDFPSAQSWQSAATQHRMEEKLVRGKHAGMAGYLNHTYNSQAPFYPAVSP
ncbi:MAG: hypothetical protein GXP26_09655 [Planctomycetes bacterium]|nr:hypothetical protein [Planctomycetota bacterium]